MVRLWFDMDDRHHSLSIRSFAAFQDSSTASRCWFVAALVGRYSETVSHLRIELPGLALTDRFPRVLSLRQEVSHVRFLAAHEVGQVSMTFAHCVCFGLCLQNSPVQVAV